MKIKLFANGQILVLAGLLLFLFFSCIASAQGAWTQKANFNGVNRYRASTFSIGTKTYVGTGWDVNNNYLQDFWMWNQATNTWTQKADFGGGVRRDCFAFSIGGKGYFGAGHNGAGHQKDLWEYDTLNNSWTQKSNLLGLSRQEAVGFSIGNKGYVGTGWDGTYMQDFWEWDQTNDTWTQMAGFQGTARSGSVGFAIGTKGYIGLGLDGVYKKDLWEWNQSTNVWTQKADFIGSSRNRAVSFVIGNNVYVGTGSDTIGQNIFCKWNSVANIWTQITTMPGNQRTEAIGLSIGSFGYIGTGNDGNGPLNDFWEFNTCDGLSTTLTSSGVTSFCNGNSTTLNASGGSFYSWSSGQTISSIVVSPTSSITYSVTISDSSSCSKVDSIKIVVFPLPATPTISVNGVVLMSSSSSGNQWYLNGNPINGATSQFYTATQNGFYTVCVTDVNGCSACSPVLNFTSTGTIENNLNLSINISPNPTTGIFQITSGELRITNIEIVNVLGEKVYTRDEGRGISGWGNTNRPITQLPINLSGKPSGIYFLRLKTPEGTAVKKIVKE